MEITKRQFEKLLTDAIIDGHIIYSQKKEALKKFDENGDMSILNIINEKNASRHKGEAIKKREWSELSELDALRTIVWQNKVIIEDQKSIKGWITFMGIMLLLSLICGFILGVFL